VVGTSTAGQHLLAPAGIGCTPIIGMINHATSSRRTIDVLHADRPAAGHAHWPEPIELAERLPHARVHRWYEDFDDRQAAAGVRLGRVELDALLIGPGTRVYLCGPQPFMNAIRDGLIAHDVPRENIDHEAFGPQASADIANGGPVAGASRRLAIGTTGRLGRRRSRCPHLSRRLARTAVFRPLGGSSGSRCPDPNWTSGALCPPAATKKRTPSWSAAPI
jgi:ferredoxin-NADP reductase